MEEKLIIKESITDSTGAKFDLKYIGNITKENIDIKQIKDKINKFLNNIKSHKNMQRNISFLRTILKDIDEEELILRYQDEEQKEFIKFDKKEISIYEKRIKDKIKIHYENKNLSLDFPAELEDSIKVVNNTLKDFEYLKDVKEITINKETMMLIEIYKLFYNESPDFTEKETNAKMQAMVSILLAFSMQVGDYSFSLSGKRKIPYSIEINEIVNNLFPLGKVDENEELLKIRKDAKGKIKVIGEEIISALNNKGDLSQNLLILSKILYASNYSLSKNVPIEEIARYTECSNEEIKSSFNLINKIYQKLNK